MSAVRPLDDLSKSALKALVKLLLVRRVLLVSDAAPYEELRLNGYAYRVASTHNGYIFNEDNQLDIERAARLRK